MTDKEVQIGRDRAAPRQRVYLAVAPGRAGIPEQDVMRPLADLDGAYRGYIDHGLFRFISLKVDIKISPKDFSATPADPARVAAVRAEYLGATNRPVEARAAIDQARRLKPESPVSYEVEGLMLEHTRDMTGAEKAYANAVELQSTNWAAALARTDQEKPLVQQVLQMIDRIK